MNEKQIIKKYIQPKGMSVVAMLLLIAALVLAIVGMTAGASETGTAQEFFPGESPNGTMAYIDVVGVSDWLYKYDGSTYYSVEDAFGYLYTVKLKDSQFSNLKDQQIFWNRETDDVPMPAAFRLEGVVTAVTSDIRTNLADCWGITTEDYDLYFGTKFLDATTTASEEASAPWFVFAALCGIFGIAFLVGPVRASRNAKKCLQNLEEKGLLERAAQQLENTEMHTVIGKKNRGIMTQDFIFGKGTGMVVPYTDIIWCYQNDRRYNFVPVNSYLMVGTVVNGVEPAVDLNKYDKDGFIVEALEQIAQRNSQAMVGYKREFLKAFKEIRKEK